MLRTVTTSPSSTPSASSAKAQLEYLRKENRTYLRVVNEKQVKILQLEAAVTNLQREVLAKGDEAKALQKQIQLLSDADRDLVRVGPLCCDLCPSLGPPTCN